MTNDEKLFESYTIYELKAMHHALGRMIADHDSGLDPFDTIRGDMDQVYSEGFEWMNGQWHKIEVWVDDDDERGRLVVRYDHNTELENMI